MREELLTPHVSSFVKSLRDIGYTFEVALADLLDNCLTANASNIEIHAASSPNTIVCILDDGLGMNDNELKEAMRLATKDPELERDDKDLGRFGLGLKTASFSQCKLLTVVSKSKSSELSAKQWDLNKVIDSNEWLVNSLEINELKDIPLLDKLHNQESGTLVVWQNIDRIKYGSLATHLDYLNKHLSLVFHRFIDGFKNVRKVNVSINDTPVKAFDPFNKANASTLSEEETPLKVKNVNIAVRPYILPPYTKTSPEEFEKYATLNGYSRSQGFYLYRADRLVTYGTWWGLIKNQDANNLVRIQVDIPNSQDDMWGITITKSGFGVTPPSSIRKDLRIICKEATRTGRGVITGRSRAVKDKTETKYWQYLPGDNKFSFLINREHPLLEEIRQEVSNESFQMISVFLKGLEGYLPIESISRKLIHNPHEIKQEKEITEEEIKELVDYLLEKGMSDDDIQRFIHSEGFDKGMFLDE